MSKVDLSKEGVVHLAHSTIQAMQCEWEGCTITLNSWNSLAKHLFRHCANVVQRDGYYQCLYSRCAGRLHSSSGALKTHVELSHLSRVALPCPARGCKEVFVRVQQFQSHFEHAHGELIDKRVSVDALAPLAILAPPRRLRPPPSFPFPDNNTRSELLLAPISIPPMYRGHSQASTSQGISRRWSRLNVQDEESDDEPIAFDDLPSEPHNISAIEAVEVEVQRKISPARQPLLSHPQPAIYPPIRSNSPEQGILYPAFVRMVDQLVATGVLAAHKEGEM